jgi:hypothetical protein
MTISAAGAGVGENGLGVAPRTGHILMHPEQGVGSLVVIKFWNGSNRLPTDGGVAVLAGHVQGTVRAARSTTAISCLSVGERH